MPGPRDPLVGFLVIIYGSTVSYIGDHRPGRVIAIFAPGARQSCSDATGHANIGITPLDTYLHVVAGLREDAAEQVAALFRSPVSKDPLEAADVPSDYAIHC